MRKNCPAKNSNEDDRRTSAGRSKESNLSLDQKMPQYATIIKTGLELFESIIQVVTETKQQARKRKAALHRDRPGRKAENWKKNGEFPEGSGACCTRKDRHSAHGEGRIYDQFHSPSSVPCQKTGPSARKGGFQAGNKILSFMERPDEKSISFDGSTHPFCPQKR